MTVTTKIARAVEKLLVYYTSVALSPSAVAMCDVVSTSFYSNRL